MADPTLDAIVKLARQLIPGSSGEQKVIYATRMVEYATRYLQSLIGVTSLRKSDIGRGVEPVAKVTRSPAPGGAPVLTNIVASGQTTSGATIDWDIDQFATGQVEWGTSVAYGSFTLEESSFDFNHHTQAPAGAPANTLIHYRVISRNAAGQTTTSGDDTFMTLSLPAGGFLYGMGVYLQTKSNHHIGGSAAAKMSVRFQASQSSPIAQVAMNQRGGSGYSLGAGGSQRWAVQADSAGLPSGPVLGTVTFSPGNPAGAWERKEHHVLVTPATVAGQFYHLVCDNPHASAASNYISLNNVLDWESNALNLDPAPAIPHTVLYNDAGSWNVIRGETPVFDILYANGQHDGNMYFAITTSQYGLISGSTLMARERFTKSGGDQLVNAVKLKARRNFGTSPLIVRLENGDGSLIEQVSIPSGSVTLVADPASADGSARHAEVVATFATPRTLVNGQTYNIRLSTAAGTQYSVDALRWLDADMGAWDGWHFRDGAGTSGGGGQKTTNGGSTWVDLYLYDPHDIPFCFT